MTDNKNFSSPLHDEHKIGLFGEYQDKDKSDLLIVKEVKEIFIFQIVKYKNSDDDLHLLKIDGLALPLAYPNVVSNSEIRILWSGPNTWMVISSNQSVEDKIHSSLKNEDFAITNLSHSRAVIEISGKNSIDVLKKGTSLNLNPTEFMKNNSANSSYSGISFIVDFISDSPLTFRLLCLRSFGGSFYHSITDAALEYGYSGE